jgi:hypothetical protein
MEVLTSAQHQEELCNCLIWCNLLFTDVIISLQSGTRVIQLFVHPAGMACFSESQLFP